MKRKIWKPKKLGILLLLCLLLAGTAITVTGTAESVMAASKKTTLKPKPKNGWYTFPSGRKRYYRKGKYLKGLQKVKNKYYLFSQRGVMLTGVQKVKNKVYYLNDKGVLQVKKLGKTYYYANGKKMSKVEAQNFATLQRAKEIVSQNTNSRMSAGQKLQTCFKWVMEKPYVTRRVFTNFNGWPAVYALDHFDLGGGNCMADAAAFAYLARALGYTNVYVCVDSANSPNGHAWAEINGLVYDPLFAQAKSYAGNYGVRYGVYRLSPILHIAI